MSKHSNFNKYILGVVPIYKYKHLNPIIDLKEEDEKRESKSHLQGDVIELLGLIHTAITKDPYLFALECGDLVNNILHKRIDARYISQQKTEHGMEAKYSYYPSTAEKDQIKYFRKRYQQNLSIYTNKKKVSNTVETIVETIVEHDSKILVTLLMKHPIIQNLKIENKEMHLKKLINYTEKNVFELRNQTNILRSICDSVITSNGLKAKEKIIKAIANILENNTSYLEYPKRPSANGWTIDNQIVLPSMTTAHFYTGYADTRSITFIRKKNRDKVSFTVAFQNESPITQRVTPEKEVIRKCNAAKNSFSRSMRHQQTTKDLWTLFEQIPGGYGQIIESTAPLELEMCF